MNQEVQGNKKYVKGGQNCLLNHLKALSSLKNIKVISNALKLLLLEFLQVQIFRF